MAYGSKVQFLSPDDEAVRRMPFTGMSREEIRLVSCPECGAGSTYKCLYSGVNDASIKRPRVRIHKKRVDKAKEYRAEHRI